MLPSPRVSRVIVVVLDGLRADAVPLLALRHVSRLASGGAASLAAQTVAPSVTAAAMGSLLTGVRPADHGLTSDRFRIPRPRVALQPLPRVLAQHRIGSHAFLASVPFGYGAIATRLARMTGVTHATFRGRGAVEILAAARPVLARESTGLFLLHWPDADRAGHAHGWLSREYVAAARVMDEALGLLDVVTRASEDPDTLLVVMADHGGGGAVFRDHDSAHPHDRTIPLILAGGRVVSGELAPCSSLLDVPATVAWAMGVPVPAGYAGRAMVEAFIPAGSTEPAARPAIPAVAQRYAFVAPR
ncbi:MAG: alkaline phosphatase family protein [Gemmatimonadaceae bacterium]|nr:alkaline phosphatase family protein [Gemmatimonadaceae bacterium]